MSFYRLLLRSLRRTSTTTTLSSHLHSSPPLSQQQQLRSFAFSSAEEAAAERRRRKRRLRIEPPLHALRRDNYPPPPRDPNAPRLPDSTSALVGPRLNLHNRVQSLIRASDLDAASAVARHSVFSNTRPTVFTCNAIIASMYRAKRYSDAIALFHFFFNQSNIVPNVVSYNNLINTHCDTGNVDTALEVYRHILANAPFSPSSVTYRHLTKGLIDAGRIGDAVDLLREMLNKGHGADSLVYNNLIAGFLNLGNLDKANELFDELKERCLVYDGVINATFMDWFFNQGREKEAMESYKSLLDRQFRMVPATCNVLIEVLLKHGKKTEAWAMFDQMLDNHTPPTFQAVNSDTFNLMVDECFKNGKFEDAIATFRKVGTKAGSRPFSMDVAGYNNIITRYCEHGMLSEADALFTELTSKSLCPDVTSHRVLIDAYLKENRVDDAWGMFSRMVDAGLRVVASFGNRVFEVFIGNGKAVDCAQALTKMGEKDPKPDPTCYEVVLKGLCSDGTFDVATDLIGQMTRYGIGFTPSLREFLSTAFGNAGRGEEIERLLSMDRWGYASRHPPQRPSQMSRAAVPPHMAAAQGQGRPWMSGPARPTSPPSGAQQDFGSFRYTEMNRPPASTQASASLGAQQYSRAGEPSQMPGQFRPPQVGGHSGAQQYSGAGEPSQMPGQFRPPQVGGHSGPWQGSSGSPFPSKADAPQGPVPSYYQEIGMPGYPPAGSQGSRQMDGQSEVPHGAREVVA